MTDSGIPSEFEVRKFQTEANHNLWRTAWDAANAAGRNATNSFLLGGGGAVVALLALLGNVLSRDTSIDPVAHKHVVTLVHAITAALIPFVWSMFLSMLTAALTYTAMFLFTCGLRKGSAQYKPLFDRFCDGVNSAAIVTGAGALITFAYGAIEGVRMLNAI